MLPIIGQKAKTMKFHDLLKALYDDGETFYFRHDARGYMINQLVKEEQRRAKIAVLGEDFITVTDGREITTVLIANLGGIEQEV